MAHINKVVENELIRLAHVVGNRMVCWNNNGCQRDRKDLDEARRALERISNLCIAQIEIIDAASRQL